MATDILLIWAPGTFSPTPINSLPTLAAHATLIDLYVRQMDLSVGFTRYLLSRKALDAHRPLNSSPDWLHREWHAAGQTIRKHRSSAFRHGSFVAFDKCLRSASSYYGSRYPGIYFDMKRFLPCDYSPYSSRELKAGARYLCRARNHPLMRYYREHVLDKIADLRPSIVGLSVASEYQIMPALALAALIRKLSKGCHITIGGRWPSIYSDQISRDSIRFFDPVDSYVVGDGEIALDGFKNYLHGRCGLDDIHNLILPGRTIDSSPKFADIRNQPPPQFEPKILAQYVQPREATIEMSRGCYWMKCAFCSDILGVNARYRQIGISRFTRNIGVVKKLYGIQHVYLGTLAISPENMRRFVAELRAQKIKISWTAFVRMDRSLDQATIESAMDAGLKHLIFTPESLSQSTIDLMAKGYRVDHVLRTLDSYKSLGLPVYIQAIAGFPGEDISDLERTLRISYERGYRVYIFPFRLEYGSHIYNNPGTYGVTVLEHHKQGIDLPHIVDYRVRRGVPHYRWHEVKAALAGKYKEWFVDKSESLFGYDTFEFDRKGS